MNSDDPAQIAGSLPLIGFRRTNIIKMLIVFTSH